MLPNPYLKEIPETIKQKMKLIDEKTKVLSELSEQTWILSCNENFEFVKAQSLIIEQKVEAELSKLQEGTRYYAEIKEAVEHLHKVHCVKPKYKNEVYTHLRAVLNGLDFGVFDIKIEELGNAKAWEIYPFHPHCEEWMA